MCRQYDGNSNYYIPQHRDITGDGDQNRLANRMAAEIIRLQIKV